MSRKWGVKRVIISNLSINIRNQTYTCSLWWYDVDEKIIKQVLSLENVSPSESYCIANIIVYTIGLL